MANHYTWLEFSILSKPPPSKFDSPLVKELGSDNSEANLTRHENREGSFGQDSRSQNSDKKPSDLHGMSDIGCHRGSQHRVGENAIFSHSSSLHGDDHDAPVADERHRRMPCLSVVVPENSINPGSNIEPFHNKAFVVPRAGRSPFNSPIHSMTRFPATRPSRFEQRADLPPSFSFASSHSPVSSSSTAKTASLSNNGWNCAFHAKHLFTSNVSRMPSRKMLASSRAKATTVETTAVSSSSATFTAFTRFCFEPTLSGDRQLLTSFSGNSPAEDDDSDNDNRRESKELDAIPSAESTVNGLLAEPSSQDFLPPKYLIGYAKQQKYFSSYEDTEPLGYLPPSHLVDAQSSCFLLDAQHRRQQIAELCSETVVLTDLLHTPLGESGLKHGFARCALINPKCFCFNDGRPLPLPHQCNDDDDNPDSEQPIYLDLFSFTPDGSAPSLDDFQFMIYQIWIFLLDVAGRPQTTFRDAQEKLLNSVRLCDIDFYRASLDTGIQRCNDGNDAHEVFFYCYMRVLVSQAHVMRGKQSYHPDAIFLPTLPAEGDPRGSPQEESQRRKRKKENREEKRRMQKRARQSSDSSSLSPSSPSSFEQGFFAASFSEESEQNDANKPGDFEGLKMLSQHASQLRDGGLNGEH